MYREAHDWNTLELAERCTAAGVALDESTISDLEAQRGDVSVQELLGLAFVLSVPPALLFLPVGEDYRVEVLPGTVLAPDAAVRWVCGQAMLAGDPSPGIWQRFARPLALYRQLDDAHAQRWNTETDLRRLDPNGTDAEVREARQRYAAALSDVATILAAMVEDGMTMPPVKDYTARDMATLGVAVPPGVPMVTTTNETQPV